MGEVMSVPWPPDWLQDGGNGTERLTAESLPRLWSKVLGVLSYPLAREVEKAGLPEIEDDLSLTLRFPLVHDDARERCIHYLDRAQDALRKLTGEPWRLFVGVPLISILGPAEAVTATKLAPMYVAVRQCLTTMPYAEYLPTDWWHEQRQGALKRANSRCQLCNGTARLEVHHRTYERRGCELPEDLIVLCRACHSRHHGKPE